MPVFASKKFPSKAHANTIASRYRSALSKHPFLLFGFPFIATMVAGSFFLTPATAIRYEKHDRRVRRMTKEEELGIGKSGRRVDMNEEYYVSAWTRKIFGRELMLCAETCSEGPGWLGTEACQETSWRTGWNVIISTSSRKYCDAVRAIRAQRSMALRLHYLPCFSKASAVIEQPPDLAQRKS